MEKMEIVRVVISSTAFAAIIKALATVWLNQRENKLKYTVDERRKWREELREIADELEDATEQNMRSVLARLKVRINPYGMGKAKDYMMDSHIWNVIQCVENKEYRECEEEKKKLQYYISLLLKYDWERAHEVKKGYNSMIIMSLVGVVYATYMHIYRCKLEYNEYFIMALIVLVGFPIFLGQCHSMSELKKTRTSGKQTVKSIMEFGVGVIFAVILIQQLKGYYEITMEYLMTNQAYIDGTIVIIIMELLYFASKQTLREDIRAPYKQAIEKIDSKEEEKNEQDGRFFTRKIKNDDIKIKTSGRQVMYVYIINDTLENESKKI